jgi:hypothetical protein
VSVRVEVLLCGAMPWVQPPELAAGRSGITVTATHLPTRPSLGDDTELHGAGPRGAEPAVVAAVEASQHAFYLRVEGPPQELDEAQGVAAEVIESVLAATVASVLSAGGEVVAVPPVVIDLATLDARFAEGGVARLRSARARDRLWIGLRGEDGAVAMETFGFRKVGQPELHVVAVAEDLVPIVSRFLNKLFLHVSVGGAVVEGGDAAAFGWVDVRLFPAERLDAYPDEPSECAPRFLREIAAAVGAPALPGVLVLAEPVTDEPGSRYQEGPARAAGIVHQMVEVARRCGYESGIDVPRALSSAVVCDKTAAGPPLQARRVTPDEPTASGWVAVCGDEQHDHDDPKSFEVVPLVALAERAPQLFTLLAAPVGTGVVLGTDGTLTVNLPEAYSEPI